MTAQGQPTILRQAARTRSQRRWPLAPGHWAKVVVAGGGYLRSAEINSNVQVSDLSAGSYQESVIEDRVLKGKDRFYLELSAFDMIRERCRILALESPKLFYIKDP
jgi:hypothetical protein